MRIKRGLGQVERPSKRARPQLTMDYARQAWTRILDMAVEDLYDPGKATLLPYPGLEEPDASPGLEIEFIGSDELKDGVEEFIRVISHQCVGFVQLVGPKGYGKSCMLRAAACILYKTLSPNKRLLCIWRCQHSEIAQWIKTALLFAYSREKENVASINALESLDDLKGFMCSREELGEEFVFIVDGAEEMDVKKWHGEEARVIAAQRSDLIRVLAGRKVIWGLTPSAEKVQYQDPKDERVVCYMEGCPQAIQKMKDRLITPILEAPEKLNHDPLATAARRRDVDVFCGIHFLSVACFEAACLQAAANKAPLTKVEDAIELLADEGEWQKVIWEFMQQRHIMAIRTSLDRFLARKMTEVCPRIVDITRIDPRYALDWDLIEQSRFCTEYIQRTYVEFVRKQEAEILKEVGYGPWVSYCRALLNEPRINWAEMGWLCGRVSSMVIARAGVDISERLRISALSSEVFYKIPNLRDAAKGLGSNAGVAYIPWVWNFGKVDAVILLKDSVNELHMIGVQFTTNKDKHQHSEDEFMALGVAGEWFADIVTAVASGELTLHFSFICLSYEQPAIKDGTLKQLRGDAYFGVLPHWLHVTRFEDALKGRVAPEVVKCLRAMADRRELHCSHMTVAQAYPPSPPFAADKTVELTTTQLKRMSRANLNSLASNLGMDPTQYRYIELLRAAMKAQGKIRTPN